MNKHDFLTKGYKQYPCPRHESDWADMLLEKRIVDDSGIKYAIHVYRSREFTFSTTTVGASFVARVQLNLLSATANIELFDFESIADMELFFARMFIATDAYYYERY